MASFDLTAHIRPPGTTLVAQNLEDACAAFESAVGVNTVAGQGLTGDDVISFPNGLLDNQDMFFPVPFVLDQIIPQAATHWLDRWPVTTLRLGCDAEFVGFRYDAPALIETLGFYLDGAPLLVQNNVAATPALSAFQAVAPVTRVREGQRVIVCTYNDARAGRMVERAAHRRVVAELYFRPIA